MLRLASHPELPGYKAVLCVFLNSCLNLFDTGLIYATKAPKQISRILSKEARCLSVFWFGRGPPPKTPKNKYRKQVSVILSKEARRFSVFWFGRGPPLESMTTVEKSVRDNLKQFLRR